MVVASDVKNLDNMLLVPAGAALAERQINILRAWGVPEVEVELGEDQASSADPLSLWPPEEAARLTAAVRSRFWELEDSNPVQMAIFKLVLDRRARRGPPAAKP